MTQILNGLGYALLGGLAAVLTGGSVELLRALANPRRRWAIFHRGFRANLRQFLA